MTADSILHFIGPALAGKTETVVRIARILGADPTIVLHEVPASANWPAGMHARGVQLTTGIGRFKQITTLTGAVPEHFVTAFLETVETAVLLIDPSTRAGHLTAGFIARHSERLELVSKLVFINKQDLEQKSPLELPGFLRQLPSVSGSGKTGEGVPRLIEAISRL